MVGVGDKYKPESMAMIKKIFIQNHKIFTTRDSHLLMAGDSTQK